MRILYCNKYNFPFSGTEVYLFELMDLMRAHGHEAALFSMADPRGEPTQYDQHFVPPSISKVPGQARSPGARQAAHALYSRQARQQAARDDAEFRPDVAHVRNIYHHLSPSILWELKAQGVPVLYHLNDFKLLCPSYNMVAQGHACERCHGGKFWHVVTEGCYAGPTGASPRAGGRGLFPQMAANLWDMRDPISGAQPFREAKAGGKRMGCGKISVLPHFQNLPSQTVADPLPDAPILYFGRLSPEKGLTDLLRAMKQLPAHPLADCGRGAAAGRTRRAERRSGSGQRRISRPRRGTPARPADFRHRASPCCLPAPTKRWARPSSNPTPGGARWWRRIWVREGNWCMRVKPASCSGQGTSPNWRRRFRFWSNGQHWRPKWAPPAARWWRTSTHAREPLHRADRPVRAVGAAIERSRVAVAQIVRQPRCGWHSLAGAAWSQNIAGSKPTTKKLANGWPKWGTK